jgi:hypothetical protein
MTRLVLAGALALAAAFAAPADAGCNHNVPGQCVRTFRACGLTSVTYELCGY